MGHVLSTAALVFEGLAKIPSGAGVNKQGFRDKRLFFSGLLCFFQIIQTRAYVLCSGCQTVDIESKQVKIVIKGS